MAALITAMEYNAKWKPKENRKEFANLKDEELESGALCDEAIERMRAKLVGKPRSEETKAKLRKPKSEEMKAKLRGIKRPEHSSRMKGRTLTEETKAKISASMFKHRSTISNSI